MAMASKAIFRLLLSLLSLLISARALSLRATPPTHCTWGSQVYHNGERFDPDPCTSCECQHGLATCMQSACALPDCVDSVRDPAQCCPVCPNGSNCRAPDGTIIPDGKEVLVDGSQTCRCQDGRFSVGKEAVCSLVGPLSPDGR